MAKQTNQLNNPATNKTELFYALLYFVEPYYLDNRGGAVKNALHKLIGINQQEAETIIDGLINSNKLQKVGNSLFIHDKVEVKKLLDSLIRKDVVKPDIILKELYGT